MRPGRLALIYRSGALSLITGIVLGYLVFVLSITSWFMLPLLSNASKLPSAAATDAALVSSIVLALGVFAGFFWRCRRRRQTLFRELWPHRLAVCPTCIYPLMRGSIRCSECGREMERRDAQQFWVGVFWQPMNAIWPERWIIRAAARRRRSRGWSRRHFGRWFKWYRPRPVLPLRARRKSRDRA